MKKHFKWSNLLRSMFRLEGESVLGSSSGEDAREKRLAKRGRRKATTFDRRHLSLEALEERQLLTVQPWSQFATDNPDLMEKFDSFVTTTDDVNVITVDTLSLDALKTAITEAAKTVEDDLILVKVTPGSNTISFALEEDTLLLDINAETNGSLSIIGFVTGAATDTALTIDAKQLGRVMEITQGTTVNLGNVTVANGYMENFAGSMFGGGVYNEGTLALVDVDMTGNKVQATSSTDNRAYAGGGAIYSTGTLTIFDSRFTSNSTNAVDTEASAQGGAIFNYGTMTVTDSTFTGNRADSNRGDKGYGGAISNLTSGLLDGTADITNTMFDGNRAAYGGALYTSWIVNVKSSTFKNNTGDALHNNVGEINISDSFVYDNTGDGIGGQVTNSGILTVTNTEIYNNTSEGIYNTGKNLIVINSKIHNNQSGGIYNSGNDGMISRSEIYGNSNDAGLENDGTLTISQTNIYDNYNRYYNDEVWGGGGIANTGTIVGDKLTITGNTAHNTTYYADVAAGGGVFNSGTFTLTNSQVSDNELELDYTSTSSDRLYGAGIYNSGTLTVSKTNISKNVSLLVWEQSSYGGGLYNSGTATVSNVLISENSNFGTNTITQGGGIFNNRSASLTLTNVDVSKNFASDSGAGIYNDGKLSGRNVTIAANSAAVSGGGIQGDVSLTNSIITYNFNGNISGSVTGGNNITEDDVAIFAVRPTFETDGNLSNGTLIDLHLKNAESSAVDTGSNATVSQTELDLDGLQRIWKGKEESTEAIVDMGAYEYGSEGPERDQLATPSNFTVTTTLDSDEVTLSWNLVTNADGYIYAYKLSSASEWTELDTTELNVTIKGLTKMETYDFRVMAYGDEETYKNSEWSEIKTRKVGAVTIATPKLEVKVYTNQTNATLSWDKIENATGYEYQYKLNSSSNWGIAYSTINLSAELTGLPLGARYDFRVRAIGDGGLHDDSDWDIVTKTVGAQSLNTPVLDVTIAETTATLEWNSVPNATSYVYQYKKATDSTWSADYTAAETTATIEGLANDTLYQFRVKAVPTNQRYGESDWSVVVTRRTNLTQIAAPALRNMSVTVTSIDVTWSAVENAVGYAWQYAENNSNVWSPLVTVDANTRSAHIENLLPKTGYDFRVKALGDGVYERDSDWTTETITTTEKLDAPKNLREYQYGATRMFVTWDEAPGAEFYTIRWRTSGITDGETVIAEPGEWTTANVAYSGLVATINGLNPETSYDFQVQANCRAGAEGEYDSDWPADEDFLTLKTIKALDTPENLTATALSISSILVTWDPVEHASGYVLRWRQIGETANEIRFNAWDPCEILFTNLPRATEYQFTVYALGDYRANGYDDSLFCAPVSVTTWNYASTVVNTALDDYDKSNDLISLREAIEYAGTYQWTAEGYVLLSTTVTFEDHLFDSESFLEHGQLVIDKANTSGKSITIDASNLLAQLASATAAFDIDGDGEVTRDIDSTLLTRYLNGYRGKTLIAGLTLTGKRTTSDEIESYLEEKIDDLTFDIDGDGVVTLVNDGELLRRNLLGLTGTALTTGLTFSPDATRTTGALVAKYIAEQSVVKTFSVDALGNSRVLYIEGTDVTDIDTALFANYLNGLTGSRLLTLDLANSGRSSAASIASYLSANQSYFDINDDKTLTNDIDVVLLERYYNGLRGDALLEGFDTAGWGRKTALSIESYIEENARRLNITDGSTEADYLRTTVTNNLTILSRWIDGKTGNELIKLDLTYAERNNAFAISAYIAGKIADGTFDIDGDGNTLGSIEGVLLSRYRSGLRGSYLIEGLTFSPTATRTTASEIETYIIRNFEAFNIDGDLKSDNAVVDVTIIGLELVNGSTSYNGALEGAKLEDAYGGAVYSLARSLSMYDSVVANSTANALSASGNAEARGGGIYQKSGDLILLGSTQNSDTLSRYYGNSASAISTQANAAAVGGGIWAGGKVVMAWTSVSNNSVSANSSGAYRFSAAEAVGGGIYADSAEQSEISYSFLSANRADARAASGSASAKGGGFYGSAYFVNSLITLNTAFTYSLGYAYSFGGGICQNGALSIVNSTIAKNSVYANKLDEGRYYTYGAGVCALAKSDAEPQYVYIDNSIIVLNNNIRYTYNLALGKYLSSETNPGVGEKDKDICLWHESGSSATMIVGSNNISSFEDWAKDNNGVTSSGNIQTKTVKEAIALFVDVTDPTITLPNADPWAVSTHEDYHLRSDSVAINAGRNDLAVQADGTPITVDLDGLTRPVYVIIDIGAYEFEGVPHKKDSLVVTIAGDIVDPDDGETSLREAIAYANTLEGDQTITFIDGLRGRTITMSHDEGFGVYTVSYENLDSLTIDASNLILEDGTPGITIDAGELSRVFEVADGADSAFTLIGIGMENGLANDQSEGGARGGALYSLADQTVLTNCSIADSSVSGDNAQGGGLYAGGTLSITESAFSGNSAAGVSAQGGGLYAAGEMTVYYARVTDNSVIGQSADDEPVTAQGGGLYGFGKIVNSLVANNEATVVSAHADSTAQGGGVYADGAMEIINDTVVANSALIGGGLYLANGAEGDFLANNSIIAHNTADLMNDMAWNNIAAPQLAGNNNIASLAETDWSGTGNQSATDAQAAALFVDTAGRDYHLNSDSVFSVVTAYNRGNNSLIDPKAADYDLDQLGRIYNYVVDVGAYEMRNVEKASLHVTTALDIINPNDNLTSLREAVRYLNVGGVNEYVGGPTITFDSTLDGLTILMNQGIIDGNTYGEFVVTGSELTDYTATVTTRRVDTVLGGYAGDEDDLVAITVSALGESRIFRVAPSVEEMTFLGLGMTSGAADNGAGVYSEAANLLMDRVTVSSSKASENGGAVYALGDAATFSGVLFRWNSAANGEGGAIYAETDTLTVLGDSEFSTNKANGDGGAILYDGASLTIAETLLRDNSSARGNGGAVAARNFDSAEFESVEMSGNTANGNGGAVYVLGDAATFTGSLFRGNSAVNGEGGAIYAKTDTLTVMENSEFSANKASGNGGAILYDGADIFVSEALLTGNSSTLTNGGAVAARNFVSAWFELVEMSGNTANANGGAVYVQNNVASELSFLEVSARQNVAQENGGAIYVESAKQALDLWVAGMDAISNQAGENGGAIYTAGVGAAILDGVVMTGNIANENGGAVFGVMTGGLSITMYSDDWVTSFVGNTAKTSGGAVYNEGALTVSGYAKKSASDGSAEISRALFSGNTAGVEGGAIRQSGGVADLKYVEITGNRALSGDDTAGGGLWFNLPEGNGISTVSWSLIRNNQATLGGGIYKTGAGQLSLSNTEVSENSAVLGAGVYGAQHNITAMNVTITANQAAENGGGFYAAEGRYVEFQIINSLVVMNYADHSFFQQGSDIFKGDAVVNGYYTISRFTDWDDSKSTPVYDHLSVLFTDFAGGDYTLCAESAQALNTGNNTDYEVGSYDLLGNPRIYKSAKPSLRVVDLGAYEYQGEPAPVDKVNVQAVYTVGNQDWTDEERKLKVNSDWSFNTDAYFSVIPGQRVEIPIWHDYDIVDDMGGKITGISNLSLRIHYSSEIFEDVSPADVGDFLKVNLVGDNTMTTVLVFDDTENYDNDDTTDKYILVTWNNDNVLWDGLPEPTGLTPNPNDSDYYSDQTQTKDSLNTFHLTVKSDVDVSSALSARINFTAADLSANFEFRSNSANITVNRPTFDVDGDGVVNISTDVNLLLRYFEGYRGTALWQNIVNSRNATRDIVAATSFLDAYADIFDVNDSGDFKAEIDGVLLSRYLSGFRGDRLIEGLDLSGGTRQTAEEISSYIELYLTDATLEAPEAPTGTQILSATVKTNVSDPDGTPFYGISGQTLTLNLAQSVIAPTPATTLSLRVHYRSEDLTYTGFDNVIGGVIGSDGDYVVEYRTDDLDLDGDESTDSYLLITWNDVESWQTEQPSAFSLIDTLFTVNSFVGQLDSEGKISDGTQKTTKINFTAADLTANFSLAGDTSITVKLLADRYQTSAGDTLWAFDIDGDGEVNMATDGNLFLRWLTGKADDETGGVTEANAKLYTTPNSLRTDAGAINDYIYNLRFLFDIDGDGLRKTSSDGTIFIQYLAEFRGDDLYSANVRVKNAVRDSGEAVAEWIEAFIPPKSEPITPPLASQLSESPEMNVVLTPQVVDLPSLKQGVANPLGQTLTLSPDIDDPTAALLLLGNSRSGERTIVSSPRLKIIEDGALEVKDDSELEQQVWGGEEDESWLDDLVNEETLSVYKPEESLYDEEPEEDLFGAF